MRHAEWHVWKICSHWYCMGIEKFYWKIVWQFILCCTQCGGTHFSFTSAHLSIFYWAIHIQFCDIELGMVVPISGVVSKLVFLCELIQLILGCGHHHLSIVERRNCADQSSTIIDANAWVVPHKIYLRPLQWCTTNTKKTLTWWYALVWKRWLGMVHSFWSAGTMFSVRTWISSGASQQPCKNGCDQFDGLVWLGVPRTQVRHSSRSSETK